jgi:uncharacterized protein YutE (UPF0331/DUF86 family)
MRERFKQLEENIKELSGFRRLTLEDIKEDKSREWALRYGFLETIQIVIDIACYAVSKYNLGNPSSYSECVELLGKFNYLDGELTQKVIGMTGLKNLLIHEYLVIDTSKLYQMLDSLDDFNKFVTSLKDLV